MKSVRPLITKNEPCPATLPGLITAEQKISGPLFIPCEVLPAGGVEGKGPKYESYGVYGRPTFPLVDFGVAIRKGESTRATVIRRWQITPLGGINPHNEE